MIRVVLPMHLRTLARVDGEVNVDVQDVVTLSSVLDAVEAKYPMLRGTSLIKAQTRPCLRQWYPGPNLS
jgi:molybdopterin synthase sulfur carrier subunit